MPVVSKSDLDTAAYFDRLAATYGAGEYYRKRREAVLGEISARIGTLESLLDLGCGNGAYLAAFRDALNPRVLAGADLSIGMLRRARDRGASQLLVACDAAAIPFRAGVWQAVFCSHVLQFIRDLPRCFSEIIRCLACGGTLIVAGGEFGTRERLRMAIGDARWAAFRNELPRPRDVPFRRSLSECRRIAGDAGFEVDSCEVEFIVTWADLAEFYRVRWLPLVERNSQTGLQRILEEIIASRGSECLTLAESLLFCRKR